MAVVIPNWNGADMLAACIDSLLAQTHLPHIIVVDNGSKDNSFAVLAKYPTIEVITLPTNLGFAGGVNVGIRAALKNPDFEYVTLFNNDAVADPKWLEELVRYYSKRPGAGIVTSKMLLADKKHLDGTGDFLTSWLLPFPRGRDEVDENQYSEGEVTSASGGASLYTRKVLERVGLFDEDFFAYYEDVDISLRAQLAGFKIYYNPKAIVYHSQGSTSSKIKGFTTYHTLKNGPLLWIKDVPRAFLWRSLPRYYLAYGLFFVRALTRGQFAPAFKGVLMSLFLTPQKLRERRKIMRERLVDDMYFASLLVYDLPPNASALRSLRQKWWRLVRKTS